MMSDGLRKGRDGRPGRKIWDMRLKVEGLACRRGARTLFEGLSFALAEGQILLVKGQNGVGKSSLLRQLAGLVPIAAGEVTMGETSLQRDRAAFQERLIYAGHLDAVKPALSVRDNLALWASVYGPGASRVDPVLERFGLGAMAGRPAAECSAGQRRRLGLARLMLVTRPLWLLDEPTVSLDAEGTKMMAAMIESHASLGGMAVIATHIDLGLGQVAELALDAHRGADRPAANDNPADPFLAGRW